MAKNKLFLESVVKRHMSRAERDCAVVAIVK